MDEDVYDGRVKEFLLQFITIYFIRRKRWWHITLVIWYVRRGANVRHKVMRGIANEGGVKVLKYFVASR